MSERKFGGWLVGTDMPRPELLATHRDASFFSHPGRGGIRHIIADDGGSACRGQKLVLDLAHPAGTVAKVLRCRRNGCKQRWPSDA